MRNMEPHRKQQGKDLNELLLQKGEENDAAEEFRDNHINNNNNNNTNNSTIQLESGTSLAEYEHTSVKDTSTCTQEHTNIGINVETGLTIAELQAKLQNDDIKKNKTFSSPYLKEESLGSGAIDIPMIYLDHTATSNASASIESYISKVVLPYYGNTHTNTSITGSQSTAFVAEARQIIAEECSAFISGKAAKDVILFTGSGTTSCVNLVIDMLNVMHVEKEEVVVFMSHMEHHSNMIPWREIGCRIVMIESSDAWLTDLEEQLQTAKESLKIGTFSAMSNVTGQVQNTDVLAELLHKYNALSIFDYATAASYVNIEMKDKDVIYFSPHKMLGGVNTPGVVIIKKRLVENVYSVPSKSGGGTVFYVSKTHHRFLSNRIERYEGGTPDIVGIVRVGLLFLLRRAISKQYLRIAAADQTLPRTVFDYDCSTYDRLVRRLSKTCPNLHILGRSSSKHAPILSFLIQFQSSFLHYNFICAILNDIFGIQSRGGCQCAGPYSQYLLGISPPNNTALEQALLFQKAELLRPGYTRISLPFKSSVGDENHVEYVLKAIEWICRYGWCMLMSYRCNYRTGEWRHTSRQGKPFGKHDRKWLTHYQPFPSDPPTTPIIDHTPSLEQTHDQATNIILKQTLLHPYQRNDVKDILEQNLETLRWFVYPHECDAFLRSIPVRESGVYSMDKFLLFMEEHLYKEQMQVKGPIHPLSSTSDDLGGKTGDDDNNGYSNINTTNTSRKEDVVKGHVKKLCRDSSNWGNRARPASTTPTTNDTAPFPQRKEILPSDQELPTPPSTLLTITNDKPKQNKKLIMHKNPTTKHKNIQTPPAKLTRQIIQAIIQYDMIQNNDRLLLGLSGGKDSLTLLHCLLFLQKKLPIHFDIEVCTIDPMTPSFDPSPLIPYVEQELGLTYHYIRDDIIARANTSGTNQGTVKSLCAYCARMKRGNLYSTARKAKCNKLVLAQHLDDCAESLFMSMMHNGFLCTMKAKYKINEGDLEVIRPLVFVREKVLTDFATKANLPIINENCPACFEEPKERARIKKLLSREEMLFPTLFDNIRRSLVPLFHEDMTPIIRSYTEKIVRRSRKEENPNCWGRDGANGYANNTTTQSMDNEALEEESATTTVLLKDATEEQLLLELAKRKADSYRLVANASLKKKNKEDDNANVCTPFSCSV